jgi:hypothetical protein
MAKGDVVDVMVGGQFPLAGSIGEIFPDNKNVHIIINSPRGRWGLLVPEAWVAKNAEGNWQVQIP